MLLTSFLRQLHPRHLRWWQWFLLTAVGLLFLLRSWLPGFLRQQILVQLASLTPAHVQLGDVDVDMLQGRIALQQLSLSLPDEPHPTLLINDLAMNVSLRALLRREMKLTYVHLNGVQLEVIQTANGQINLGRLFPPPPSGQEQPPTDLPTLTILPLQITDSKITYRDLSRTPEARLSLAITTLTTSGIALQANGLATPVTLQLQGALNDGPLSSEAQVLWQREQTLIEADVEAQQIALASLEPYLHDVLTVQKLTGQIGTKLHYRYQPGIEIPRHGFSGTVNVKDLQFVEAGSEQTVFALPEGHIKIEILDFLAHYLSLQSIELKNPQLSLVQSDKGFNVASWLRTTQADASSSQGQEPTAWYFSIATIKWMGGELRYRNNAWQGKETLSLQPEEISARDIDARMYKIPFQFRTRAGDGKLAGEGTVWFALPPNMDRSEGSVATLMAIEPEPSVRGKLWPFAKLQVALQANDLDVASLQPLLTPVLAAKQVHGKLTGDLNTVLFERDDAQAISVHGNLGAKGFSLSNTPEQGHTLRWEDGQIVISDGSSLLPFSLSLEPHLSRVVLQRPEHGDLTIEKVGGKLRLAQGSQPDQKQKVIIVGALDTAKLSLAGVPEAAKVLAWDTGRVEIHDGSTMTPFALHLKAQLDQLSMRQLPQGDVAIEKTNGELWVTQEPDAQQQETLKIHGPVEFTGFALTQGAENQILLGCHHGKATINKGSRVLPLDIRLRDVALEYAYAQGMRPPSGPFQLFIPSAKEQTVIASPTTPAQTEPSQTADTSSLAVPSQTPASPTAPENSTLPVSIQIDRATIIGGQLYFEDRTVSPPQTVYWQDVRVDLSRAGYPTLLPATFAAFAYNEDGAPVELKGTTERKGERVVVRINGKVEKVSLPRFNSYLEPSLGYRVKKGAVSATWDLVIPGDRVQANMTVTLHDINLGGKRKSSELEQQVGLPLALVIALLKDLNGDISLQLPVEGRFNEPGFQWSGTVVRAIRDVVIGAVTSPLKVLGALFKGKDKLEGFTLEPIHFLPGTRQIKEDSQKQLSRLALFLTQRPNLDLRLGGVAGPQDQDLLRDQLVLNQLPARPATATNGSDTALQVTPQDEVRQFLAQKLSAEGSETSSALSSQAGDLLTRLRKTVTVPANETERLARDRVQVVIDELTTRHTIAANRLHVSLEKQRGPDGAEVRYTIQTREEKK